MNDSPQEQPAEEEVPRENASETEKAPGAVTTPPGMLPLVEPYFGKRAFAVAAVPFLIYFIGTAFGGYLETTRKTGPAHDIRGYSRSLLGQFIESLQSVAPQQSDSIIEKYDLRGVEKALDDESSKVEVLYKNCSKLLEADVESEPLGLRQELGRLQAFVQEFIDIYQYWEDDELNKIRPSFTEFAEKYLPEDQERLQLDTSFYPALYTVACLAAAIATLVVLPTYLKRVPFRISLLAVGVGTVGVVAWIALWWLNKEYGFGNTSSRAAYNPLEELKDTPTWMWTFLGIRLLGMVIVVPIVEEFFLRGFLMRYCEDIDWDQIPIGEATWRGWAGILGYALFSHVETAAALVWFSMVTWLYLKTKNIWDCVIAHAVTNGLLAAFVLATGTWALW